jgi:hypothetical protein
VGGIAVPAVAARVNEYRKNAENYEDAKDGNPLGRPGDGVFVWDRGFNFLFAVREIIFGEEVFLVEAKVAGDSAHKTAIENASGKLAPIFVFEGFQKTSTDSCGGRDFAGRNLAQFALALQTFPKISPGHDLRPVPDHVSAATNRQGICGNTVFSTAATAKRPATGGVESARRHYRRGCWAVSNHEGDSIFREKFGYTRGLVPGPTLPVTALIRHNSQLHSVELLQVQPGIQGVRLILVSEKQGGIPGPLRNPCKPDSHYSPLAALFRQN